MELLPRNPVEERAYYTFLVLAAAIIAYPLSHLLALAITPVLLFVTWLYLVQPYVAALVEARQGRDTTTPEEVADHLVEFTKRSGDVSRMEALYTAMASELTKTKARLLKLEDTRDAIQTQALIDAVDDDPLNPISAEP